LNYALNLLRQELNREISFAYQFEISIQKGRKMTNARILDMQIRHAQDRVASLRRAIAGLKPKKTLRKPGYYWLPRT